ncbi:MAG: hypothetical protein LBT86_09000 [Deltaproteobacteria bacterium]|nr:hypothetical protein [Deltaproteobacteria bacterium]
MIAKNFPLGFFLLFLALTLLSVSSARPASAEAVMGDQTADTRSDLNSAIQTLNAAPSRLIGDITPVAPVCKKGYLYKNGKCVTVPPPRQLNVKCPINQTYDPAAGKCKIPPKSGPYQDTSVGVRG